MINILSLTVLYTFLWCHAALVGAILRVDSLRDAASSLCFSGFLLPCLPQTGLPVRQAGAGMTKTVKVFLRQHNSLLVTVDLCSLRFNFIQSIFLVVF